jgi:UDP-N-acetylmuramoyl-tripeptide--D-alanyl-D-alanine ligase
MQLHIGQALATLRSPAGRVRVAQRTLRRLWPLFRLVAGAYRRSVVRRTRLVAVVGSVGKTTTTRAVAIALGLPEWRRMALNSFSTLALAVLRIRPWQKRAVLEVGIGGPGQMAGYAAMVRPTIAVVTAIASDHNRSLGTLENTRSEKARMVEALPPSGVAVLNGDDPNVLWMRERTRARIVTYGFGPDNHVAAADLVVDWPRGTRFSLHAGGQTRAVQTQLIGRHQAYAVLAAIAVSLAEGVPVDLALDRLAKMPPSRSRLQPVPLANGAWLLRDDFKGGLETYDAALDALAEIPARQRVVVLGEVDEIPGSAGDTYRRLGARLVDVATRVVTVGGKERRRYGVGARQAGLPAEAVIDARHDLQRAVEAAAEDLGPGDVVLVKVRNAQRLARVSLALMGRPVRCAIQECHLTTLLCDDCPMLTRGSGELPVIR